MPAQANSVVHANPASSAVLLDFPGEERVLSMNTGALHSIDLLQRRSLTALAPESLAPVSFCAALTSKKELGECFWHEVPECVSDC